MTLHDPQAILAAAQVPTPLLDLPALARLAGVRQVLVKDEGCRPLGNFKVTGGLAAGLRALERAGPGGPARLVCASDGNHGLAVAAAARARGAQAWIFLPAHAGEDRARRIADLGAEVVRVEGTYDAAVEAARAAARDGAGLLIPDTSDDPDDPVVADVMAGYGDMARELVRDLADGAPTHLLVQAGVGGLAAALADGLADAFPAMRVVVVEPELAACVGPALALGRPVQVDGDLDTCAGMLACGLASAGAVRILLARRAQAITVGEAALAIAPRQLALAGGPASTPSGAAGLAGLLRAATDPTLRTGLGLDGGSRVLLVATERALDAAA